MPVIKDYYEPWFYNYEHLTTAKQGQHSPVAKAHSVISGDKLDLQWGPNWEDDLAGAHVTGPEDPNIQRIEEDIKFQFDETFMMYLPRLCEHCLNQVVWHHAHLVQCTNGMKMVLYLLTKKPAVVGVIA